MLLQHVIYGIYKPGLWFDVQHIICRKYSEGSSDDETPIPVTKGYYEEQEEIRKRLGIILSCTESSVSNMLALPSQIEIVCNRKLAYIPTVFMYMCECYCYSIKQAQEEMSSDSDADDILKERVKTEAEKVSQFHQ